MHLSMSNHSNQSKTLGVMRPSCLALRGDQRNTHAPVAKNMLVLTTCSAPPPKSPAFSISCTLSRMEPEVSNQQTQDWDLDDRNGWAQPEFGDVDWQAVGTVQVHGWIDSNVSALAQGQHRATLLPDETAVVHSNWSDFASWRFQVSRR